MPFSLDSWDGDHAGKVVGREPNTIFISVTMAGTYPHGLFQSIEVSGFKVFTNCAVKCLTPNAIPVVATNVKSLGGTLFSVELAELGFSGPTPWTPGVHLFGVTLDEGGTVSSTIATAIIGKDLPFIEFDLSGSFGSAFFGLHR